MVERDVSIIVILWSVVSCTMSVFLSLVDGCQFSVLTNRVASTTYTRFEIIVATKASSVSA